MACYRWKTTPYKHQIIGVKKLLKLTKEGGQGAALLCDPRTGKSKMTIDYISILAQTRGVRKAVIVCPPRVMGTWRYEFELHSPLRVLITTWDAAARKRPIPKADPIFDLHVVLVNYEAFSTPGTKLASGRRSKRNGRFKHRALLHQWINGDPCVGVLDEMHKISSPSGRAATLLVSSREMFSHRLGLTGTPVPKARRIEALYMQWKWINPDRFADVAPTIDEFRKLTGTWISTQGFPQWVAPREAGVQLVRRRIHEDSFSVKREDCFDLPPREHRILHVDIKESAKVYDDMATKMLAKLTSGDVAEASIALVLGLRLSQITAGHVTVPDKGAVVPVGKARPTKSVRVGNEKMRVLKEILEEEVLEHEQKVVICAQYKPDLDAIAALCHKLELPCWSLRGGMSQYDGEVSRVEFTKADGPAAFVMHPKAGGVGIDLRTASQMIWYGLPSSWIDFTQACDRIALSRTSTTFTYLLMKNTIDDQVMYPALQDDTDMGRLILTRPHLLLRRK